MALQEKIRIVLFSLIDLIDAAEQEELVFRPAPDSWTLLECVEHICLVNAAVANLLSGPPAEGGENKPSERYSEGKLNHILVTKREEKRVSPETMKPKGIFQTAEQAKEMIYKDTERILRVLDREDISKHTQTIPHPRLGEMTKTDWLHFLIAHTQRHLFQIEEIKDKYSNGM